MQATVCEHGQHLLSKLWPQPRYRCESCQAIHGTQNTNGAVDWNCYNPACVGRVGPVSAKQTFLGYVCSRCGVTVEVL